MVFGLELGDGSVIAPWFLGVRYFGVECYHVFLLLIPWYIPFCHDSCNYHWDFYGHYFYFEPHV